jgi:GDP-mannose 6-dehydrogenase
MGVLYSKEIDVKISVFGLGYVGLVNVGGFLSADHEVVGVDIQREKIERIRKRKWPIFEPEMDRYITEDHLRRGKLYLTKDGREAILKSNVSVVSVGTPSLLDGDVDLSQLKATLAQMIAVVREKKNIHHFVIRSTIPPGTMESVIMPLFRSAGLELNKDHTLCFMPEFLREGSAFRDFFNPSLNVVGYEKSYPKKILNEIFPRFTKNLFETSCRVSEMIKYVNNCYHALKIAFANEIGCLATAHGINSDELMRLFCADEKLNISPYYFKPGFSYGGSCLPKELRAIHMLARKREIEVPLLGSISRSNEEHIDRLVRMIQASRRFRIGFMGITFKPNTDDIRESGILSAVEKLLRKIPSYKQGITPVICDRDEVVQKIKGRLEGDTILTTNQKTLIEKSNMIILGPLAVEPRAWPMLLKFQGPIVDLKWHKVPSTLKKKANYRKFC